MFGKTAEDFEKLEKKQIDNLINRAEKCEKALKLIMILFNRLRNYDKLVQTGHHVTKREFAERLEKIIKSLEGQLRFGVKNTHIMEKVLKKEEALLEKQGQ